MSAMNIRDMIVCCLTAALMCGCSGGRSGGSALQTATEREFPVLNIPAMYSDPSLRMEYAALHYWDAFLSADHVYVSDSTLINGVSADALESQFATYAALLSGADAGLSGRAAGALMDRLEAFQRSSPASGAFARFAELARKYFYDPNSPYLTEDVYGVLAERLAASDLTPSAEKPAYEYEARMCSLNRPGTPAADFRFKDVSGRSYSLYGVKAEYTLLFFSNPGCEACRDIIDALEGTSLIRDMVDRGSLAVANIYIDEDMQAWRDYLGHYPKSWYTGYDPTYTIRTDVLYNVRAIPSLYLLDAEKKVIMKDASLERVLGFFDNLK